MTNSNASLAVRAKAVLELRRRRAARNRTIDYSDLRILDKALSLVPLHFNRVQQHLLNNLTGRDLVLKARQQGVSTAIQAYLFKTAITETARVGTLAHDWEGTKKLRDMAQLFYDELPMQSRPARDVNNATRTYYPDTRSTIYINTAGSKAGGRAGTYSHVHGSEVAYWKDAAALMAGLLQGVPVDGQIILESTPNGAHGWFYERCMEALNGKGVWKLHFYAWWWEDGYRIALADGERIEYTADEQRVIALAAQDGILLTPAHIKWRRHKQSELNELFAQEYPEDPYSCFLTSGNGYFQVSGAWFTASTQYPRAECRYVAGLDFGQSNDYTVCVVINATTREQVAMLRVNRQSWADMRLAVRQLCERWRVDTLVVETNSMGNTNIEALYHEFEGTRSDVRISAFTTTHSSKTTILAELRRALDEGGLRLIDDAVLKHELTIFSSRQTQTGLWQLSAPTGEHDDCVMALAFAWHAAGSGSIILGGN